MSPARNPCFLVSPPSRLQVRHLLNPWMHWHEGLDGRRAGRQWDGLVAAIVGAGGDVEVLAPAGRSGALTFTRDTAVVTDDARAVVLRNAGVRGDLEPRHVRAFLRRNGYVVEELPSGDRIDGGNIVLAPGGWLIGIPPGDTAEGARRLAPRLGGSYTMAVPLASAEFGHLDTVLACLGQAGWLVYPGGLVDRDITAPEWDSVWAGKPVIVVEEAEARALACNVVVIGETVIGGGLSLRLCREIDRLGLHPVPVDLDEFRKAGGGAHCLTLPLTVPPREGNHS